MSADSGGPSDRPDWSAPASGGLPETIGKYKVLGLLGSGAQGCVYLAHDPHLDIDVAVKCLTGEVSGETLRRFWEDAKLLARLTHAHPNANIVGVKDYNADYPFIVLDYCEGGDLNRVIKSRERLTLSRIVEIVRGICQGLMVAHEQPKPIIHRDVKPSNVLFHRGVPMVVDFGLGKQLGGESTARTSTRGMLGTIRYTSPEQAEDARSVDARTDVWALGVILYELLSWMRPFDQPGDGYLQIAIKLQTKPPQPLPFSLPAGIQSVVDRALEKDLQRRFGSAREMDQALAAALAEVPDAESMLFPPEARVTELDLLANQIARLLAAGDSDAARETAERLSGHDDALSLAGYWGSRVHTAISATRSSSRPGGRSQDTAVRLATIETLISGGDFEEARQRIGALLRERSQMTQGKDLLLRLNKQEREFELALENARTAERIARTSRDLNAITSIWQVLQRRYPANRFVLNTLATAEAERDVAGELEGVSASPKVSPPTTPLQRPEPRFSPDSEANAQLADVESGNRVGAALRQLRRLVETWPENAELQDVLRRAEAIIETRRRVGRDLLAARAAADAAAWSEGPRLAGLPAQREALARGLAIQRTARGEQLDAAVLSTTQLLGAARSRLREELATRRALLARVIGDRAADLEAELLAAARTVLRDTSELDPTRDPLASLDSMLARLAAVPPAETPRRMTHTADDAAAAIVTTMNTTVDTAGRSFAANEEFQTELNSVKLTAIRLGDTELLDSIRGAQSAGTPTAQELSASARRLKEAGSNAVRAAAEKVKSERERWDKAVKLYQEVAQASADSTLVASVRALLTRGAAASKQENWRVLRDCSDALLATVHPVSQLSLWRGTRERVLSLTDRDYPREALAPVRRAIAADSAAETEKLALELSRSRAGKEQQSSSVDRDQEIPEATRALNARLHPAALRAYDQALAVWRKSTRAPADPNLAISERALRVAREALVEPPSSLWPRYLAAVVPGLLLLLSLPWWLPGRPIQPSPSPTSFHVGFVVPAGSIDLVSVQRDGEAFDGLASPLTSSSLELPRGSYELQFGDGRSIQFEVPGQRVVGIGLDSQAISSAIERALGGGTPR